MKMIHALALIGLFSLSSMGFMPASAVAQEAPKAEVKAKVKAKTKVKTPPKNASEALIANARTASLSGLSLTNPAGKVVAKLKKPLDPGKKIALKLPAKAGCTFVVNAAFADDAEFEQAEINLCLDKNIRLTD